MGGSRRILRYRRRRGSGAIDLSARFSPSIPRAGAISALGSRAVGSWEDEGPAGTENPDEFTQVVPGIARFDVLERDVRIDQVEPAISEQGEVRSVVQVEPASPDVAVQLLCPSDHRRSDIHAVDFAEVLRQRAGQSADPAAEVQCCFPSGREPPGLEVPEERGDLVTTPGEVFVDVPLTAPLPGDGQCGPQRIPPAEDIPHPLRVLEAHPLSFPGSERNMAHTRSLPRPLMSRRSFRLLISSCVQFVNPPSRISTRFRPASRTWALKQARS
jgi:hypothetical protein